MKLRPTTILLGIVMLGLLSGCAYIEGRKEDQKSLSAPVPDKKQGQVIQADEPAQPLSDTSQSPGSDASKMIAPVTQAVGNL